MKLIQFSLEYFVNGKWLLKEERWRRRRSVKVISMIASSFESKWSSSLSRINSWNLWKKDLDKIWNSCDSRVFCGHTLWSTLSSGLPITLYSWQMAKNCIRTFALSRARKGRVRKLDVLSMESFFLHFSQLLTRLISLSSFRVSSLSLSFRDDVKCYRLRWRSWWPIGLRGCEVLYE